MTRAGRSHGGRELAGGSLSRPVRERWVGQLMRRGRFLVAAPFFERGTPIRVDRARDARPGELVLVRSGTARRGAPAIEKVLGSPDRAKTVIEALMLDRGLMRRFPGGVEHAAADARSEPHDVAGRRDLRTLTTFTIDPVTAKDFDDAISAEEIGTDRWRVHVHIADVTAYVRPGSAIDREAFRRSTSVYVPGAVEPMLPEALSNDACSLRPGEDKLAVTAEMELDGSGSVVKASFYRSTIRSDVRLDYDRVDRIFDGSQQAAEPWAAPLAAARAAAAALDRKRARQGSALTIDSGEPEFRFDENGDVERGEISVQTESHRLIEHLMIAANEQVATLLAERGVPALYRVHEHPDGDAVERLMDQLHSLGVATPPTHEGMTREEAAAAVAQASRLIDQHAEREGHGRAGLTSLLLRTLKQAHYSPLNLGHAGLGLTHYCHFTSPIRRYPDVICHRALLSAVGAGEEAPRVSALGEAGEWTSGRERDAMVIERTADDVARAFLLEREWMPRRDTTYDGEVVGLIGAGAFIRFQGRDGSYEGMLPVRRLRGDWWELNEHDTALVGADTGREIKIGDPIRVAVGRVDTARGRVDLEPSA